MKVTSQMQQQRVTCKQQQTDRKERYRENGARDRQKVAFSSSTKPYGGTKITKGKSLPCELYLSSFGVQEK